MHIKIRRFRLHVKKLLERPEAEALRFLPDTRELRLRATGPDQGQYQLIETENAQDEEIWLLIDELEVFLPEDVIRRLPDFLPPPEDQCELE